MVGNKALCSVVCLAVIALLSIGGGGVCAGTIKIDFEDLGVALGTQLNPAAGVGVTSRGFPYTPGPNNASGFNDLHIGSESFFPSNGTTVGGSHDDVVLTAGPTVAGGKFTLVSFDFAGWPDP